MSANEPKWTPGPWEIVEHSWSDTSIIGPDRKVVCCVSIEGDATEENQCELEAKVKRNFALIASAPDLYAVVSYAVDNPEFDSETCDKMARAALSKALGE